MPVEIKHTVLAPIDNFQTDELKISINENISIVGIDSLPDDQRSVFFGDKVIQQITHKYVDGQPGPGIVFNYIPYLEGNTRKFSRTLERSNYAMRWYFEGEVPDPFRENYDLLFGARRKFKSIITALRLLDPNPVGLFPEEHFLESNFDEPVRTLFSRSSHPDDITYPLTDPSEVEPYTFKPENLVLLKELARVLDGLELPRLSVALARLNNQYNRDELADRIIDAAIALEALYIDKGETELQYRVALRAATHLGAGDPDKREKIFTLVRAIYDVRSKIVHGEIHTPKELNEYKEVKKDPWKNAQNLLYQATELVREGLRTMLSFDKKDFEGFHKRIDTAIRRGEPF